MDETLLWEAHISEVVGNVAKVLADLRNLRPICPHLGLKYPRHNLQVMDSSTSRLLQRCVGLYQ